MSVDVSRLEHLALRVAFRAGALARDGDPKQLVPPRARAAADAATELCEYASPVELVFDGDKAWVNDHELPSGPLTPIIASLGRNLLAKGARGLLLTGESRPDQWTRVMAALLDGALVEPYRDGATALNEKLAPTCPVRFISQDMTADDEPDLDRRARASAIRALQLYERALIAVRQLFAGNRPISRDVTRLVQELVELHGEHPRHAMALLATENPTPYVTRHPVDTTLLAIALGRRLGLSRSILLDLGLSALAADWGMALVPEAVLSKEGELTDAEQRQVERHPLDSAWKVLGAPRLSQAARRRALVAFESHIGVDGSGYPAALGWPRPHLFSRIIAVADSYHAMLCDRPWRKRMLPDEALKTLVESAGTRMDPVLVKLFVNLVGRYPVGTCVLLSTAEVGVVYLQPEVDQQVRPVVRLITDAWGEAVPGLVLVDLRTRDPSGSYRRTVVRALEPRKLGVKVKHALFSHYGHALADGSDRSFSSQFGGGSSIGL